MLHNIKAFLYFLKTIYQQKYIIKKLVIRDFQKKYLGSYLGLPWAFLQPAAYILSLWFVFSIGLRGGEARDGAPFLFWLMAGIIPWFFISESINNSSTSLLSFAFLIKQMHFRVGIIPFITIFTALIIHLFMVLILMIFSVGYGFYPTIYWLQLPYYLTGAILFLTGLGWLTSSILIFVRDVQKIITVLLTLLFWTTPIFWPHTSVTGKMRLVVDLNPVFYITNGYRETFINQKWFFENINLTIYFWALTAVLFVSGAIIFQRLKPHFADVL
jgi:lipopolysaccharide transport system permease protein/teichoic acid transport system permease protein